MLVSCNSLISSHVIATLSQLNGARYMSQRTYRLLESYLAELLSIPKG